MLNRFSKDKVFQEHWEHARHVENERLSFTMSFAVMISLLSAIGFFVFKLMGGSYSGAFNIGNSIDMCRSFNISGAVSLKGANNLMWIPIIMSIAGLVLSGLGYFLTISWRAPFVEHTALATKMLKDDPRLSKYKPYDRDEYKIIKFGFITAHELFLYFYGFFFSLMLFILIFLSSYSSYMFGKILIIVTAAVCLICDTALAIWSWRDYNKKEKEKQKLEEEKEKIQEKMKACLCLLLLFLTFILSICSCYIFFNCSCLWGAFLISFAVFFLSIAFWKCYLSKNEDKYRKKMELKKY